MSIIALPRWNDPDAYYSQVNNVVESILGKTGADRRLESCGPTAAVMAVAAIDRLRPTLTPGGWDPQPEDLLTCWMNDPRNYAELRAVRTDIDPADYMGNQVPQYYEAALRAVFGVKARFCWGMSELAITTALTHGRAVLATLVKPGHYICIVAYDTETKEAIYHDPWPGNNWPERYAGKPGALRRMNEAERSNLKPHRIEVG